jgi:heptosyltransferase I
MTPQTKRNIAIIKLSALGDIVHTIPAFNILRKQFPDSKITWFAEPAGAKLLQNFEGIDEIVELNLKTGGVFSIIEDLRKALSLYRNRFDLVIDFQGLLKSAVLAKLLKGDILGFDKENLRETQARFFYTRRAAYFDETRHVIYKNIHLIRELAPALPPEVAYPLKSLEMSPALKSFMTTHNLEVEKYVIANVGGGWETKLLSFQQNVEIIDRIKHKYKVVILWGTEKEKEKSKKISEQTGVLMADFFNFSDLIVLIRGSRLIVTADTLAMHLADITQTPSVGIFGPTSPWRNGSLLKESVPIYEELPCGFCYKKKCGTIDCIKNINTERIVEAIEKVNEK